MFDSHWFARVLLVSVVALGWTSPATAEWVHFVEETGTRLDVSDPSLVVDDPYEKNYAAADFDKDGDIDLVIFRKEPFLVAGKLPNVLLINENGVLTDRTADFAIASDLPGDQGFLTATNDRDVVVVDLDLDGWLDLVTATTISPGEPKSVGHPRIYMNLGCQGECNGTADWLGFEHQDARIPAMLTWGGQSGFNPCFCDVAAADVTGNGYPDLWFSDYDKQCSTPVSDFESRLLVNLGPSDPGRFVDETDSRFLGLVGGQPFPVNVDSLAGAIADLNNDGVDDIILESEGVIDVAYSDPGNQGSWSAYDTISAFSTYFMDVADLNNDGLLDLITTDDAADRYYLNQGVGDDDMADFLSFVYTYSHTGTGGTAGDDGFGDETVAIDLDKDGWLDVLTFDVDFEVPGCGRRAHIYHNLGGQPGDNVNLQEQTTGSGCQNFLGNPETCLVASIPADKLVGTYDIATFDINGDSWPDLVIGRCSGTEIYISQPPAGGAGSVPDGSIVPGSMLTIAKAGTEIALSWGNSCTVADNDFAIYQGDIANGFESHSEVTCSTGGSTTHAFEPASGSAYYLVVPNNGVFEGAYGFATGQVPRQQGISACAPMNTQSCQ